MTAKLTASRDNMIATLDNYVKTKENIDIRTGGNLTDEQLSELTWMKTQVDDWTKRANEMTPLVKKTLADLSNNLELRLASTLNNVSSEGNASDIEAVGELDNKLGIGSKRIKQLMELSHMEDSRLAAILTSPKNEKFVEGLIEDINSFGSDIIASLDKQNVVRLLQDLPKIGKGVQTYNKKLEEYLTDPAKIQGDIEAATQQVATQQAEKKAADLKSRLSAANSVSELRSIITEENMDSAVEGVLGELEAEGNQVAKNYRETAQYNRELNKALSETGEDE